jgi:hypothetical protein
MKMIELELFFIWKSFATEQTMLRFEHGANKLKILNLKKGIRQIYLKIHFSQF